MQSLYVPDFDVKVNGLTLPADVRQCVLQVSYDNSRDAADMFTIRLADTDLALADSDLYTVGAPVELYMGYAGNLQSMMSGEIAAAQLSLPQQGAPTLTLTGYDKSQPMRHNNPGRMTYKGMNDSQIASQIATENQLTPVVDSSSFPEQDSVQQTGSDWALLTELAKRNGFELFVSGDNLYFRLPQPETQSVVLKRGLNLMSFEPRLSTAAQAGIQVIRSYNYELAQTIVAVLPSISLGGDIQSVFDRMGTNSVQQLMALGRQVANDQPIDNVADGLTLAKTLLLQLLDGLFEGSGTCPGMPQLTAGSQIEIQGVGKRFSGAYRLRKVTHTIDDQGYRTHFEVTQNSGSNLASLLRQKLTVDPSPKSQSPVNNVAIGVVKYNIDSDQLGRVWVYFPRLSDQNVSGWARLATLSNGTYFVPDVGTEVLVAFEQGDANRPYVLGSLWNGQNKAPETNPDGLNLIRMISTPAGHQIKFDDTDKQSKLTVTSAGGHQITLDDTEGVGKIQIQTASGEYSIVLDDTQGAGQVEISENGGNSILLQGGSTKQISIKSAGDLDLSGNNINLTATGSITLQTSGVTATLDSTTFDVS
jgi:phage protein D/phage baseplate assembly protein gpV